MRSSEDLLNSSSTEEPLPLMCTVRHSEAHSSPSRTKDWGCYDNACPHVQEPDAELAKFKWEQLYHPTYSLDMLPCDFQEFGPLKKHLKVQCFILDNKLKDAVKNWISSRLQTFWEHGIPHLVN